MSISIEDFKELHKPKETKSELFLKELGTKELYKDIDTLLKEGYQTKQIMEYIKMNGVKVVVSSLNTYLSKRSKELGLNRQPKQLNKTPNKQTKKGK